MVKIELPERIGLEPDGPAIGIDVEAGIRGRESVQPWKDCSAVDGETGGEQNSGQSL
jgi:hypothetical protein